MTKRKEILNTIRRYKESHKSIYGIKRMGVFGSLAENSSLSFNDIDIVVEMDSPDLFYLIGIKQELEETLGYEIDIVRYREKMNPYLKRHIDREAVYV